jgi:GT2 family glycosyltransferase
MEPRRIETVPRLGIAIVHFHAEALLADCLAHLRASSLADFRVHLVDCGSRAGLRAVVGDDPRVRLIEPGRNLGFAVAANLAFAGFPAGTPWLLSLNPDVLVEADTLETLLAALAADPALGAATCRLDLPSGAIDPACRRGDPTLVGALAYYAGLGRLLPAGWGAGRYHLVHLDATQPHRIDSGTGAFLMLRRAALDACGGGFDEAFFLYGEDLDLCRRIRAAGFDILYTPAARATHVKGSGRPRSLHATWHFQRAMWTYYRRWGRFRRNPLVLATLLAALLVLGLAQALRHGARRLLPVPAEAKRR